MNYTIANSITLDYNTHDIKNTFFIHVTSHQTFCYHMCSIVFLKFYMKHNLLYYIEHHLF